MKSETQFQLATDETPIKHGGRAVLHGHCKLQKANFQFAICILQFAFLFFSAQAADRPFGISKRIPWTTSRLTGSPDPPPPYKIVRAFPKLTFKNPLLLTNAPGTERLFIGEQVGKLYSFPNDPAVAKTDLFLDLTTEIHSWGPPALSPGVRGKAEGGKVKGVGAVYGLTFHPQFAKNRFCY